MVHQRIYCAIIAISCTVRFARIQASDTTGIKGIRNNFGSSVRFSPSFLLQLKIGQAWIGLSLRKLVSI